MTSIKNKPHRIPLHTGLSVLFLLFPLLPGLVWADCEGPIFRKYIDEKYSGIKSIVLSKAGSILKTRPAMQILDGLKNSYHYNGETRTYDFLVLKSLLGEVSGKIKVEETYWDDINGEKVDPEEHGASIFVEGRAYLLFLRSGGVSGFEVAGCGLLKNTEEAKWKIFFLDVYFQRLDDGEAIQKLWRKLLQIVPEVKLEAEKFDPKKVSRQEALEKFLQITEHELERIPRYPLKIMAEIIGLLAERDELSQEILFNYFIAVKGRLKTNPKSGVKLRRKWSLLLASDLAWFRKESIDKVLIPYLAEELKGFYSVRAEFILHNIGTIDAIDEIRKHNIGN